MAAERGASCDIQLIHGQQKLSINVAGQDGHGSPTVEELSEVVFNATGVPSANQKLIFKGKSLTDPSAKFCDLGLKNGSKIMLIGKKFNPEDDVMTKKIQDIEGLAESCSKRLEAITEEIGGIDRGFLVKPLQEESLKKLVKKSASCAEELTRLLEKLDALSLSNSAMEIRAQRKRVVGRIQDLLSQCDRTSSHVQETLSKVRL